MQLNTPLLCTVKLMVKINQLLGVKVWHCNYSLQLTDSHGLAPPPTTSNQNKKVGSPPPTILALPFSPPDVYNCWITGNCLKCYWFSSFSMHHHFPQPQFHQEHFFTASPQQMNMGSACCTFIKVVISRDVGQGRLGSRVPTEGIAVFSLDEGCWGRWRQFHFHYFILLRQEGIIQELA